MEDQEVSYTPEQGLQKAVLARVILDLANPIPPTLASYQNLYHFFKDLRLWLWGLEDYDFEYPFSFLAIQQSLDLSSVIEHRLQMIYCLQRERHDNIMMLPKRQLINYTAFDNLTGEVGTFASTRIKRLLRDLNLSPTS